jgi:hypothetical protein
MKAVGRALLLVCVLQFLFLGGNVNFLSSDHARVSASAAQAIEISISSGAPILYSSVAVADFNGDGYKEIVAGGSDGKLHIVSTSDGINWSPVWSHQCNDDIEAAGPPTSKSMNTIQSTPAIADLDADGHLDIVIALGGDVHDPDLANHYNGGVLVYRYNSAWDFSLLASLSPDGLQGWPQPRIDAVGWPPPGYSYEDGYWDGIATTPALGDLDGDGDLEIVVGGIDLRFHAWHHTGEGVAGWPITGPHADGGLSSPALGDLDNDGLPEVVLGTKYTNGQNLWAINGDGTNVPGFPLVTEQYIHSSPALADIDKDGYLEIVVAGGWGSAAGGGGRDNIVYAINHDGTPVTNWPQETAGITVAPPAVGDIDNDGDLEIVVGCGWHVDNMCHQLYAWEADGSLVSGFPMEPLSPNPWIDGGYTMPRNPILADFDGDNTVEILITHQGAWGITVVEPNGVTSDHTSHSFPGGIVGSPVVDDIDGDGSLEILVGGGNDAATGEALIKIWDEVGANAAARPWPMFRRDVQRTGSYLLPAKPAINRTTIMLLHSETATDPLEATSFRLRNEGGEAFTWNVSQKPTEVTLSPDAGSVKRETVVAVTIDTSGLSAGWSDLGDIVLQTDVDSQSTFNISVRVYFGPVYGIYLPTVLKLGPSYR